MSEQPNKQPPKGWLRTTASPMRANTPRLMSPVPNFNPRHHSPSPSFNAKQLSPTPPIYNPGGQQSNTPALRHQPAPNTGFTTVYESQRSSPSRPPVTYQPLSYNQNHQFSHAMSPIPHDLSYPRPYRNEFSPQPTSSTPSSIPPFSPPPMQYYNNSGNERHQIMPITDFYVVPLEPTSQQQSKGIAVQEMARPSTADIIAQQSQDYVDEKLAEYQATIFYLQGKTNSIT